MAAYTNDLRLKEIATGDESGTWGTSTNTNLELIAEAFSFGTEAITTNADTHATTIADGSTDEGRSIYLKYTGTLDSACTITLGPNTVSKLWFIENATSGSQNIIISQGSGANVTIPNGHVKAVYSDGAGSGAAIVDAFTDLNLAGTTTIDVLSASGNATIGGTLGVTGVLTADAGIDIDNINIDGTTIALSSGDLTLDVAGDIILDVDGDNVFFKDGSSNFFSVSNVSGDAYLGVEQSDKDLLIRGNDGGTAFTALTLDMSDAGTAIFNNKVGIGVTSPTGKLEIAATGTNAAPQIKLVEDSDTREFNIFNDGSGNGHLVLADSDDDTPDTEIVLADNGVLQFKTVDTEHLRIDANGNFSFGGGGNATNFTGYVTLDLRDTTGGLIDFSNASNGIAGRIQSIDSNSFQLTNVQNQPLILNTNNTERLRITADGLIGIGETSPDSILHIKNSASDSVAGISLENDANRYAINVHGGLSDGLAIFNAGAGETQLFIDSAGRVGIGADNTSPDSILSIKDATADPIVTVHKNSTGVSDALRVRHGRGLSGFNGTGISFRRNDGTQVGSVTIGFSSVIYNTTSDYRIKENVTYTWDATTRLKQLKPARFTFKDDTSDVVDGFIAHEVSSIVPEAITGEKDAVDSEGNPEYQGIDQSKLVPLLVKTIQELEARITALES